MGTPVSWIICARCLEPVKADEAAATKQLESYGGEEACTTWDATNGLRCVVDGCTHNAAELHACPCHVDRPAHTIYVHRACLHRGEIETPR